jgi:hypothetical protein
MKRIGHTEPKNIIQRWVYRSFTVSILSYLAPRKFRASNILLPNLSSRILSSVTLPKCMRILIGINKKMMSMENKNLLEKNNKAELRMRNNEPNLSSRILSSVTSPKCVPILSRNK